MNLHRDEVAEEQLRCAVGSRQFWRRLIWLQETPSTNDELRRLAQLGAAEGTVVGAEFQSAGRGRRGRRWEAPPGTCLLLSILFRPLIEARVAQWMTMLCSLAVADAVNAQTGLVVALKWPNDLMLGGAKLGGILTETALCGQHLESAVVGIGLNVNLDVRDLPAGLTMPATSLSHCLGRQTPRLPLLVAILDRIEARYTDLIAGGSPYVEWAARLATIGRPVRVVADGLEWSGFAEGVDENGGLLVRLPDGRLEVVTSADVMLRERME